MEYNSHQHSNQLVTGYQVLEKYSPCADDTEKLVCMLVGSPGMHYQSENT